MADLVDQSRSQIPDWLLAYLPQSAEALQQSFAHWIRDHASQATDLGKQMGRLIVHLLVGMVIGALAALYDTTHIHHYKPLSAALHQRIVRLHQRIVRLHQRIVRLHQRIVRLHQAFKQIVFAQVRIAGINAAFTGIFLALVLPMAGVDLPFVKTMILITFVAGLLPVIGNLISNTVIVVISLLHSLSTAAFALLFLVTIHKF